MNNGNGDKGKFNYGKAEAALYDCGCPDPEEIYNCRSDQGKRELMGEYGLNADKFYEKDSRSGSGSGYGYGSGNSGGFGQSNPPDSGFGCFLTSACVEAEGLPDDCVELSTLRAFRDGYVASLPEGKDEIAHYYEIAPSIVSGINQAPDAPAIWKRVYDELVVPSVELISSGSFAAAFRLYKDYTLSLRTEFCAL